MVQQQLIVKKMPRAGVLRRRTVVRQPVRTQRSFIGSILALPLLGVALIFASGGTSIAVSHVPAVSTKTKL